MPKPTSPAERYTRRALRVLDGTDPHEDLPLPYDADKRGPMAAAYGSLALAAVQADTNQHLDRIATALEAIANQPST